MPQTRVRIFPILMVLFLAIPIFEVYLLVQVANVINWLPTIGLVVLTAVMGASLLKSQGSETYQRFNQALSQGRMPANEILEGVALLIGGALLLTPGFFTDAIGFICLLPFTRKSLIAFIISKFNPFTHVHTSSFNDRYKHNGQTTRASSSTRNKPTSSEIIEGEVVHRSDDV